MGAIAQTVHCNHRMAPDTKKPNSRLPPGCRVMEKSIVAMFAEPLSLHYLVFHYFRESISAQQDGKLDCHISIAGQPQYIHQQEQHAEDQEVILVAQRREVVPEKAAYFLALSKRGEGGGVQPESKGFWLHHLKVYFQLLRKCCFSP